MSIPALIETGVRVASKLAALLQRSEPLTIANCFNPKRASKDPILRG
jgi:hypothetical protein